MRSVRLLVPAFLLLAACGSSSTHSTAPASSSRTTSPPAVASRATTIPPGGASGASRGTCASAARPPARYRHVVVIMLENRRWSDVGGPGFGGMPYLHKLARSCAYYTQWLETDANQNSLTQYIGITSGVDNKATVNDCNPSSSCRSTDANIFRQVRSAHLTPRSYVEGATSGCSAAGNAAKHIPALYYYGGNDHTYCNAEVRPYTELDVDRLPAFAMITPTLCDDGHDCGNDRVDAWLSVHLAALLHGADYRAGTTAVFVCYDEDRPVPNLVIAPTARRGPLTLAGAGHRAVLRTWDELLGLPILPAVRSAPSLRASANI